jgi:cytochrome c-type biogenesis protein
MSSEALIVAYPLAAAATALLAGLASSVSPCTVASMPLVVGYVGGYSNGSRRQAFIYSASFVLGLSLAFTAVGLAVALAGAWLLPAGSYGRTLLVGILLLAGASLLSGRVLPGMRSAQCSTATVAPARWKGIVGAFATGTLSGVVFAPCATPVMVGILALIGQQGDVWYGAFLMFLYSLGHGALLLAAGSSVGFAQWLADSRWAGQVNRYFTRIAGLLLLLYGLYLLGQMAHWF